MERVCILLPSRRLSSPLGVCTHRHTGRPAQPFPFLCLLFTLSLMLGAVSSSVQMSSHRECTKQNTKFIQNNGHRKFVWMSRIGRGTFGQSCTHFSPLPSFDAAGKLVCDVRRAAEILPVFFVRASRFLRLRLSGGGFVLAASWGCWVAIFWDCATLPFSLLLLLGLWAVDCRRPLPVTCPSAEPPPAPHTPTPGRKP